MMLTEQNRHVFKEMVDGCREAARESMGVKHEPICILQLAHSGRYSRPEGKPTPIIAHHSKILDPLQHIDPDSPLISDDELDRLQDAYVHAARLAAEAGFDGVDVKSCHGYLLSELLASHTRENSRYGGPEFDNRTRFLQEIQRRLLNDVPDLIVTFRLNAYDGVPSPYGWGVDENHVEKPDLREPIRLMGILKEQGAVCLNMSIGNPYFAPHFSRPHDVPIVGAHLPDEHPLVGVHRIIQIARELQISNPELPLIGSGYTYFREFLPWFAAGVVKEGWISMIGLGRQAFAYPSFAKDILQRGCLDPSKVCIACSRCSQIMRDGGRAGCVIRDGEVYGPIFREGRKKTR
jgi:2,4-dienoyl-CoA reductase-like NADH-dependent reductase (Old Yellow Enzyme family)